MAIPIIHTKLMHKLMIINHFHSVGVIFSAISISHLNKYKIPKNPNRQPKPLSFLLLINYYLFLLISFIVCFAQPS